MNNKDKIRAAVKGKKILLFGAPGSGKGARAADLKDLGLVHVASGIALRARIRDDKDSDLAKKALSFMTRGELVPDDITVPVVFEYLERPECRENGFVLDGFPRTKEQCGMFLEQITPDLVIYLDVPRDFLFFGVIGCTRLSCPACGSGYSDFDPPRHEGICDKCGGKLEKRVDDTYETIKNRLDIYEEKTKSFLPVFEQKGIIIKTLSITIDDEDNIGEKYLKKLKGVIYRTDDNGRKLRMLNNEGMRIKLYELLAGYF